MAAGFEESYIRLWSLKGDSLNGMRSDFQTKPIRDGRYTFVSRLGEFLIR
jgi:transcription initiation factor TFIID subunit 5